MSWRDTTCGALRAEDAGKRITLAGWVNTGAGSPLACEGDASAAVVPSPLASAMRFLRSGEPQPVGKSQPGVAGSGLLPTVTSLKSCAVLLSCASL